ncbi:leucyl/phenylalanyl-tRNA--protein transferase [Methylomonas rhizoryzae]|uniref:leucyl/phenylalanyl-tRNA--protein transferase n=1 Tax=Methylomonas rhizoryzae TaxID=2608981 RepID=UPI0012326C51|nr:leucyl/phenylalanyl-tRNA--protein transferase [Methylomonas rhizoryzae]
MQLVQLDSRNPGQAFPPLALALSDPEGLLAYGGCLSPQRLLNAYRHGIFPWYGPGEPILWWSPNPRLVLFPDKLQVSRSLRKTLRRQTFDVTFDKAFSTVMQECAAPREGQQGTWITQDMLAAYSELHRLGYAHSVEAWHDGVLAGGLYGVTIGRVFFGESMFHRQRDASKVAFVQLVQQLTDWGYRLIDCQVSSGHLLSLGAQAIPRTQFADLIADWCGNPAADSAWQSS